MASWHECGKTRNVHLGSNRKMDAAQARQKAREKKAEALRTLVLVERQPMQSYIASLYIEAEINQCFNFAASRLRVKPDPVESHAKS